MAKANRSSKTRVSAPTGQVEAWHLNPLVGDTIHQTLENIADFSMFLSIANTGSQGPRLDNAQRIALQFIDAAARMQAELLAGSSKGGAA